MNPIQWARRVAGCVLNVGGRPRRRRPSVARLGIRHWALSVGIACLFLVSTTTWASPTTSSSGSRRVVQLPPASQDAPPSRDEARAEHDRDQEQRWRVVSTVVAAGAALTGLGLVNVAVLMTPLSWGLAFAGYALAYAPYVVVPVALLGVFLFAGIPSAVTSGVVHGSVHAGGGALVGTLAGGVVGAAVGFATFWGLFALELQQRAQREAAPVDNDFPGILPAIAFGALTQVGAAAGAGVGAAASMWWFAEEAAE